jgi:hypothetical protein
LLDAAGHRRSLATMPGYHQGRPPRNNGLNYPADPPTVEEIVAMRAGYGSEKRSRWPRPTSTAAAVPCSLGAERAGSAGRLRWIAGHGTNSMSG